MTIPCFYHGRDNLDYIVTFSIGGKVWDYWLANLQDVDTIEYLAHKVSVLRALNWAKRRAARTVERRSEHV